MVLDLRNNPGGLLTAAVEVSEQFVAPGKLIVSIKGRDGKKDEYFSRAKDQLDDHPMIIWSMKGRQAHRKSWREPCKIGVGRSLSGRQVLEKAPCRRYYRWETDQDCA